ncbi:hypothetical protein MSPP1_000486 [Malassezia sp. CBS 17886]|nr:hypothetical protein MSPP1_000486 [Malassezia sp. CBS 17886]
MSVLLSRRATAATPKRAHLLAMHSRAYSQVSAVGARLRPRLRWWTLAAATSAGLGYVAGAKWPPRAIPFVFSPYSTEMNALSFYEKEEHCREVERELHQIPYVRELTARSFESKSARRVREACDVPEAEPAASLADAQFVVMRPFVNVPPMGIQHQFTAASLRGPGRFAATPLVFSKTEKGAQETGGSEGDGVAFVHLGGDLCGFEGVIHGGLIATIFDEALARSAFYALPNMVGVTAKLEVDYRRPVRAGQFVAIESHIVEAKGRKTVVRAELCDCSSRQVLAEAKAVFVEPRWAKMISWVGGLNVRKLLEE